jgi:hypothetical protein
MGGALRPCEMSPFPPWDRALEIVISHDFAGNDVPVTCTTHNLILAGLAATRARATVQATARRPGPQRDRPTGPVDGPGVSEPIGMGPEDSGAVWTQTGTGHAQCLPDARETATLSLRRDSVIYVCMYVCMYVCKYMYTGLGMPCPRPAARETTTSGWGLIGHPWSVGRPHGREGRGWAEPACEEGDNSFAWDNGREWEEVRRAGRSVIGWTRMGVAVPCGANVILGAVPTS